MFGSSYVFTILSRFSSHDLQQIKGGLWQVLWPFLHILIHLSTCRLKQLICYKNINHFSNLFCSFGINRSLFTVTGHFGLIYSFIEFFFFLFFRILYKYGYYPVANSQVEIKNFNYYENIGCFSWTMLMFCWY